MSTKKTQSSIGGRLRAAIAARRESLREFSDRTGIPYRSLQQYLRDERAPGAEALGRIAAHSGIDLHYLLLGEGAPYRASSPLGSFGVKEVPARDYDVPGGRSRGGGGAPALDVSMWAEVVDTALKFGLAPMILAARRGSLIPRVRVLAALDRVHPEGLALGELQELVSGEDTRMDLRDLAADLALLVREGKVEALDAPAGALDPTSRYRTTSPAVRVDVESFPDRCQHLLEALRILVRTVFPHLEADDGLGKLATGELTLPREKARAFLAELLDLVERFSANAQGGSGQAAVSMVVAAGVSDEGEAPT